MTLDHCERCKHSKTNNGTGKLCCIDNCRCLPSGTHTLWEPVETTWNQTFYEVCTRYMPQPTVMPDEPTRFRIEEEG